MRSNLLYCILGVLAISSRALAQDTGGPCLDGYIATDDVRVPEEPADFITFDHDQALKECGDAINCEVIFNDEMGMYLPQHKEGMGPGSDWYKENVEPFDPDYDTPDSQTIEEHERDFNEYMLALLNDDEDQYDNVDRVVGPVSPTGILLENSGVPQQQQMNPNNKQAFESTMPDTSDDATDDDDESSHSVEIHNETVIEEWLDEYEISSPSGNITSNADGNITADHEDVATNKPYKHKRHHKKQHHKHHHKKAPQPQKQNRPAAYRRRVEFNPLRDKRFASHHNPSLDGQIYMHMFAVGNTLAHP